MMYAIVISHILFKRYSAILWSRFNLSSIFEDLYAVMMYVDNRPTIWVIVFQLIPSDILQFELKCLGKDEKSVQQSIVRQRTKL